MRLSVILDLTTAQRNAIPTAIRFRGLKIRNADTGMDERWDGTAWRVQTSRDAILQTIPAPPVTFQVDWSKGIIAQHTMSAAVTTNAGSFLNPIIGVPLRLILINPTGGNLNFILAPAASHKAANLTVTVNANRRRTLVGIWNGTLYDWEVGALKA